MLIDLLSLDNFGRLTYHNIHEMGLSQCPEKDPFTCPLSTAGYVIERTYKWFDLTHSLVMYLLVVTQVQEWIAMIYIIVTQKGRTVG